MLRRDHQLKADLGRIYSFSLGLRMDEDGYYRRPDVMACRIYARQTLEDIARSQDDPFNYRLLDLWLDVFQRPWDQPTNLHQLLDDLAREVGCGELKVYLDYDPCQQRKDATSSGSRTEAVDSSETVPRTANQERGSSKRSKTLSKDEKVDSIVDNVGTEFRNSPLREEYEQRVAELSKYSDQLEEDLSLEEKKELAEKANQERRQLGVEYKDATPEPLRDFIYEVNRERYDGDPLGPDVEFLVERKGKTYSDIVHSASRPNPNVDKLLAGFRDWLAGLPEDRLNQYSDFWEK